jgi:hypothetical protein
LTTNTSVVVTEAGDTDRAKPLPAPSNYNPLAWFMRNEQGCKDIVTRLLGQTWTNLPDMAEWLEAHVPSTEHGAALNAWMQELLTDELRDLFIPALATVGMYRGSSVKNTKKDQVDTTGARQAAMEGRINETVPRILSGGISVEESMYSVGHRPRTDEQDGTIDMIVAKIPAAVRTIPWVAAELARSEPMAPADMDPAKKGMFPKWDGPFGTESKMCLLLVLIALWRHMVAERSDFDLSQLQLDFKALRSDDDSDDVVLAELERKFVEAHGTDGLDEYMQQMQKLRRTYMSCEFTAPTGLKVIVLNAPVTIRKRGEPRPTTASTLAYKLRFFPPKPGAKIIAVSGPFHGQRVIGRYETDLHTQRPDVHVTGFWLGAGTGSQELITKFPNALSEFVHLINAAAKEFIKLQQECVSTS